MLLSYCRSLWARLPIAGLLGAAAGLGIGYLAIREPKLALTALAAGVVVSLFARDPIWIALLAGPSIFNVSRIPIGYGISVPDVVLFLATLLSLPALVRLGTPRRVTNARRWLGVYVVAMLATCALHPNVRGLLETAHRAVLVGGALGVGAWIYLAGRVREALRLLIFVATVAGIICIAVGAVHGFRLPAEPFGTQKNYVGSVLGLSMLVALAAPNELGVPTIWRDVALVIMGGGLAATHSRAAMLSLAVGIFVWFFRTHRDYRRRSFLVAVVLFGGFLAYSGYLVNQQVSNTEATQKTNSVAIRNKTNEATLAIWKTSPIDGVGVYYYYHSTAFNDRVRPELSLFVQAPTNVLYEALAEGGIVLLIGFVAFQAGAIGVLFRSRNALAVAGLALVADRLFHGMFDIYWTAGDSSLPWLIAGMGLAQATFVGRASDDDNPAELEAIR